MNSNQISKFVVRPALTGATAYALTWVFIGNEGYVPILSMELSPAMAIGTVVAVGDIGGTLIHDQLMKTKQMDGFANAESMVMKPIVTGLSVLAISSALLGPPDTLMGAAKLASLGASSAIGGKYAGDAVVPMI